MYTLQQILKVDIDKMEANFWDEKKRFEKIYFFLVAAVDQPYLDLKFESNPSILTVPTNSLNTHLFRYKNEALLFELQWRRSYVDDPLVIFSKKYLIFF